MLNKQGTNICGKYEKYKKKCHYQDKCTPITSSNINQQLPEAFQSLWSEHGLHIVAFIGSSHKSLGSGLVSA